MKGTEEYFRNLILEIENIEKNTMGELQPNGRIIYKKRKPLQM
jgi:hypothetical protein